MSQFNASIVIYNQGFDHTIQTLIKNIIGSKYCANLFVIDNSENHSHQYNNLNYRNIHYIFNNQNLGYGKAHNIALNNSIKDSNSNNEDVKFHLVVNPDIELKSTDLDKLVDFMDRAENQNIGHLMPKVLNPDGSIQYLCKRLPTPFDLIARRFFPKNWFKYSQYKFEMRETGYNKIMDVPYLSGSFMFLRLNALKEVGLFDERFFMYPEDIDLTRRIGEKYRTIFYPEVSIVHHHAQGSYKSFKLLWIHLTNMIKYFNKWGWSGK